MMFYLIGFIIGIAMTILMFDFLFENEVPFDKTILVIILAITAMILVLNMLMGDFGFGMRRTGRILSISNIEERAKKLEEMGVEKMLKKSKATILNTSLRGNSLYVIDKMIPNYELKYLVYEDPSTKGKMYGCFVPSDFNKADQAMGWKWELTELEYQNDLIYEA